MVGILQREFAEKLNVNRSFYTKFENDDFSRRPEPAFIDLAFKTLEAEGVHFLKDTQKSGFGARLATPPADIVKA